MNAGEILNSTYEIKEKIGAGGGGMIYRAYHTRLKKDVVLKKIHHSASGNEKEKEILKNLRHSRLPQVYDFWDTEDGVFTVIDYIPGQSFEKLLKEGKKIPQKKVIKYALQLCDAVDYLHKQNPPIVHGDIKPANIMLTPDDNICLIDFNISGVLDGRSTTVAGYSRGYAAPEQAEAVRRLMYGRRVNTGRAVQRRADDVTEILECHAEAVQEDTETLLEQTETVSEGMETLLGQTETVQECAETLVEEIEVVQGCTEALPEQTEAISECRVDVRADIYGIAATLYHFLTGIRPDENPDKIVSPSELDPSIGESISIIIMKALSRDPAKRFQTVEGLWKAFQNIHKYDAGYKRMVLKQELIFLAEVLCIGIGVLTIFFGRLQLEEEREEAYVQAVTMLKDAAAGSGDLQMLEDMYESARQINPGRLEAYLQKAVFLYQNREYEEAISFVEDTILTDAGLWEQDSMADVYFVLGNCYFEMEQYEDAIVCYGTAIDRNGENPDYYRDYVIAFVRDGQISKAEEVLKEAREKEISTVDLCLINGELKKAEGDYTGAEQDLSQCIKEAGDDYLRMRAYVILDMVYREEDAELRSADDNGTAETGQKAAPKDENGAAQDEALKYLMKSRDLLEEARTKVGMENQLLIYERLAQTYIDLEELTADSIYGENAEAVLGQMLELDSENYSTYKRFAFLEVDKQNQKENADRGYEKFLEYYGRAKELYEKANVAGGDAEMQLLDNLYQQLVTGGWIE